MKCRFCGSTEVYRSRRRGLSEKVFYRVLSLSPFRCSRCNTRFHSLASVSRRKLKEAFKEAAGFQQLKQQGNLRLGIIILGLTAVLAYLAAILLSLVEDYN